MSNDKPTVGAEAYRLMVNQSPQEVGETSKAMNKDWEDEVWTCIQNYEANRPENSGPFHVVILHKKERLMKNVIRRYFFARETEPTPTYDQVVYRYEPKERQIKFKWSIPDIETYHDMVINGHLYPLKHQELVSYCKGMNNDTLADYQKEKLVSK